MEHAGLAPGRFDRKAKRQAVRHAALARQLADDKTLAKQVDAKMRGEAPYPARDE